MVSSIQPSKNDNIPGEDFSGYWLLAYYYVSCKMERWDFIKNSASP